jgi:hypothetical protein
MFDLCTRLGDVEARRRCLDAEEAQLLAELEADRTCDVVHGLSTAGWWAREHDLPGGECRRRVRVASRLVTHFGVVLAAVGDGRISWAHARVISDAANPRVLDLLVGLQAELIGLAEGTSFTRWEQHVRAIVCRFDVDGGHNPSADRTSSLKISPTIDGFHQLNGWFTGDHGVPLHAAIEQIADELFHQAVGDHTTCADLVVPTRGELRALALVELCRRGMARNLADSRPPLPECTLVMNPDRSVTTGDGDPVDATTMAILGHDPMWRFLQFDTQGAILRYGRGRRHATTDLRKALGVRDGGCVFPGCQAPINWCDAHHVKHWNDHGTTDPDNLVLLCRHHHGVTHRNHWTMHPTGGQKFSWTTPTGHTINSQRHHQHERQPQPPGAT